MSLVVLRRWTFAIFAQTNIKNEVDDVIYETFYFDYIFFATLQLSNANILLKIQRVSLWWWQLKIKVDDKLCYQMKQLTFLTMATKRFTVVGSMRAHVNFSDWILLRMLNWCDIFTYFCKIYGCFLKKSDYGQKWNRKEI